MTAWETNFTLDEIKAWKDSVTDDDLKTRIDEIIKCVYMLQSNKILVTVRR